MNKAYVLLALLLAVTYVVAECPNACSGHGSCGPKDECACYKNYQGNDCSLRTCQFGYAHVDTPKGDLDGDNSITYASDVISGDAVYPQGTTEFYQGSDNNIGHFYMECSNKGLCNRESGECECLPGYEGSSCQRANCPNQCSHHGSCTTIKAFAEAGAYTTAHDSTNADALGTAIYWNYRQADQTAQNGATTYTLWDERATYGCMCDPGYQGADCSEKRCKYGVDPLYLSNAQAVYESSTLQMEAHSSATVSDLGGTYKLRFYDVFGQDFLTAAITAAEYSGTSCTPVEAALQALPNGAVPSISCYAGIYMGGVRFNLEFTGNPGILRPMAVVSSITGTSATITCTPGIKQGEFVDRYHTLLGDTLKVNVVQHATTITMETDVTTSIGTGKKLLKIGDYHLVQHSMAYGSDSVVTLYWPFTGDAISSGSAVFYSTDTLTAIEDILDFKLGATTATFSGAPTISVGDEFIFYNQRFRVRSIATAVVTTDRPFGGIRVDGSLDGALSGIGAGLQGFDVASMNPVRKIGVSTCTADVTGGTWDHHLAGAGAADTIAYDATAAAVQTALRADQGTDTEMMTVSGPHSDATYTGCNHYFVTFFRNSAMSASQTACDVSSITGGGTPACYDADVIAGGAGSASLTGGQKLAHKITPVSGGTFSYVEECSGRGVCDRTSGLCDCFRGYHGDSCSTQNALAV